MDMFLQAGYGMMEHNLKLLSKWGKGTVILSPKDMTKDQMLSHSEKIARLNGYVMIDPQFYVPRTLRGELPNHFYWPQRYETDAFFAGDGIRKLLDDLMTIYVEPMQASAFIIPTLLLNDIDKDWNQITEKTLNELEKMNLSVPKYCTLCINTTLLSDQNKTHDLLEQIEHYPVDGFYIIPIHPENNYLVEDVSWLINLMDLCAGIKILNKKVILGYSSHQFLLLALTKIDAICAGTWLKTRMFPLGDFADSDDQKGGRRRTWYYCPQALTEYQIDFLDIAYRLGILERLKTPVSFGSSYTDILFTGAQPSTVNFSEREAFRHYLHCLKMQCNDVVKETYDDTLKYLRLLFETALEITSFYRSKGVRGKHRDFSNVAEINISLLDAFDSLRGLIYRHKWSSL
jgi:hypothetical protein